MCAHLFFGLVDHQDIISTFQTSFSSAKYAGLARLKSRYFFTTFWVGIFGLQCRNNGTHFYHYFIPAFGEEKPPLRALHIHPRYLSTAPFCVHEVIVDQTINGSRVRTDMILNNMARPKFDKKHLSPLHSNITP